MANSVDPDQTAPIGAVCSGSTLFASILNSSVMYGNYLQQTTSADDISRCIFLLDASRDKTQCIRQRIWSSIYCLDCFTAPSYELVIPVYEDGEAVYILLLQQMGTWSKSKTIF